MKTHRAAREERGRNQAAHQQIRRERRRGRTRRRRRRPRQSRRGRRSGRRHVRHDGTWTRLGHLKKKINKKRRATRVDRMFYSTDDAGGEGEDADAMAEKRVKKCACR